MKKKTWTLVRNRMLILSIFMLTVFTFISGNAQAATKIDVGRVEITGNDVIAVGKNITYKVTTTPTNATNKAVLWSVSPLNGGATIDNTGKLSVNAKCELDSVIITATSKDNAKIFDKKEVFINKTPIKALNVVDENGVSIVGKTITLYRTKITPSVKTEAVVYPKVTLVNENLKNNSKSYKFISTREDIVSVDQDGNIKATGNGIGTAVIKLQANDATRDANGNILTKTFSVKVIEPAENVEITGNDILAAGKSATYKANVTPTTVVNRAVTWSVFPENSGATITTAGVLKIEQDSTLDSVDIIAISKDNNDIVGRKTVAINGTAIKSFNLVDENGIVSNGKVITLYKNRITNNTKMSAVIAPKTVWVNENISNKNKSYKYTSSREDLVTVNQDGLVKVTGKGIGKSVIKCQAIDGSKDAQGNVLAKSYTVNVVEPVDHIEVIGANQLIGGNNSASFKANVYPANAANKKVIWSVYPENEGATVSQTGLLKVDLNCKLKEVEVIAKAQEDAAVIGKMKVAVNPSGMKGIVFLDNDGKEVPDTINLYRKAVTAVTPIEYQLNPNISWKLSGCDTNIQPYVFSSTDETIATVDQSGHVKVTGEKVGTCKIKCVAIDGSKNSDGTNVQRIVTINVTNPFSKILIDIPKDRSKYVANGKSLKLLVTKYEDFGTVTGKKDIIFTSSNPAIATVNSSTGVVTFKKDSYSSVIITATVNNDTKLSTSIELIGSNPVTNIQVGNIPANMFNNDKLATILTASENPVTYSIGFNTPNPGSAKEKTVCPELIVTSSKPEYLEAGYTDGVLYLWPKKAIGEKVKVTITSKDGNGLSKYLMFKISAPEELSEGKLLLQNNDELDILADFENLDDEQNVSKEVFEEDEKIEDELIDEKIENSEDIEIEEENTAID